MYGTHEDNEVFITDELDTVELDTIERSAVVLNHEVFFPCCHVNPRLRWAVQDYTRWKACEDEGEQCFANGILIDAPDDVFLCRKFWSVTSEVGICAAGVSLALVLLKFALHCRHSFL